jgi:hypothetical protein
MKDIKEAKKEFLVAAYNPSVAHTYHYLTLQLPHSKFSIHLWNPEKSDYEKAEAEAFCTYTNNTDCDVYIRHDIKQMDIALFKIKED